MYKVVKVGNTKYYIQDRSDMIALTHKLASQGYSISQIAKVLGVTERTVIKYLQDCW